MRISHVPPRPEPGAPRPAAARWLPTVEVLVALTVFVTAWLSILITRVPGSVTLFWPVNGIAAALLIRLPRVRWFSAALGILLATFLATVLVAHRPWPVALLFDCVNCAEITLMVIAFRVLWRFPYPDITINQAVVMTGVSGIVIPGVVGLVAAPVMQALLGIPLADGFQLWWSSHTVGACLVGPPIVLFSVARWRNLAGRQYGLANAATMILILAGSYLLIRYVRFPFAGIATLLLIGAFRFEGLGAALAALVTGLLLIALWLFGIRPIGLEKLPTEGTLIDLPVIALLAAVMPPIAVGIGMAARRSTLRALRMSERRFRESMEHSPIGMLIADMNGVWTYTNVALQRMLGYTAEELRALPPGGPSAHEEWEGSDARRQDLLSGKRAFYEIDRRFRHKDGHWIWTHVAVSLLRNEDGSPQHLLAQIESLEARRQAESALAEERERLRVTVNSISDAVITLSSDMRIDFINESAQRLLGLDAQTAGQRRIDEVMHLTDATTSKSLVSFATMSALHGRVMRRETPCVLHRPDGGICYVLDSASPVFDSAGRVTAIVLVLHDATADVERTRDLRHRATYDPLTGLVNRAEFQQRLRDTFRRSRQTERPAALLAIDLDRFKAVNDTAGHAAGDEVLRRVAQVCRAHVRASDTVARLGGDEFAVLLDNCSRQHVERVCRKVLESLNPLELEWEGVTHRIGASIGVASLSGAMVSESDWMEAADRACYLAKSEGRGQLRTAAER